MLGFVPDYVIVFDNTVLFTKRLGKFWSNQPIYFEVEHEGTEGQSYFDLDNDVDIED